MTPEDAAAAYVAAVRARLDAIAADQLPAIQRAAALCHRAVAADGLVYLFGSGHSHLLAEEGHYRAGGLAAVCPVLASGLMLHEGAAASTALERVPGVAPAVLARYGITANDALIVFSNSGVNAAPVEAARHAKGRGAAVVAVTALAYAAALPTGPAGAKLAELADAVIDNHGPPGDALVSLPGGRATGPHSTVAGAFILNALLTALVARLAADGTAPPVYISSNMPDAAEHNARLVARYRARNPHL